MTSSTHPLDQALALQPLSVEAAAAVHIAAPGGQAYAGHTHASYWNMVGPFGGITAATLMQAVMQHPARLGEPLSLTVNYAGALVEGDFHVLAVPVRTNRSTQHWTLSLMQADAQGQLVVTTTGTAVTAVRRETWSQSDAPMPAVPAPDTVRGLPVGVAVAWLDRYDMRFVEGALPREWDGGGDSSRTRLWVRDQPPRPLDFSALTGLADVFYPRLWLRRARQVPTGTVSMTVYFHAGSAQLAATGSGYLLAQAQAQEFRNGFFDQTAQLWNEAGTMLATTHQVVYYKE